MTESKTILGSLFRRQKEREQTVVDSQPESVHHYHDVTVGEFDGQLNTEMSHYHPITEPNHIHSLVIGPAWVKERTST